ncbi:hypothetical protein LEP1GSC039_3231 [Leptospira santarosai str. 2000027870]|nr:hypothetical protein LEP1GSC039_3231 [Leptospira santarosai str. 2000027870]
MWLQTLVTKNDSSLFFDIKRERGKFASSEVLKLCEKALLCSL